MTRTRKRYGFDRTALALAALLWCMIDCRLPLAAWLIPAMLLIGGLHETE